MPGAPRATFLLFTVVWGYAGASGGPNAKSILIATINPTVRFGMLEGSDPQKFRAVTELFERDGFTLDIKATTIEWLWVHHTINAGGIWICLWAGGIAEAIRSSKTLKLGIWAISEALAVVAARGVDLERYLDAGGRAVTLHVGTPAFITRPS